jgi:hypothetical protein
LLGAAGEKAGSALSSGEAMQVLGYGFEDEEEKFYYSNQKFSIIL